MGAFMSNPSWPDIVTAVIAVLSLILTSAAGLVKLLQKMDVITYHLETITKGLTKHEEVIEKHTERLDNHHERIVKLESKA